MKNIRTETDETRNVFFDGVLYFGWPNQPSSGIKNLSTLCQFLPLYSSFICTCFDKLNFFIYIAWYHCSLRFNISIIRQAILIHVKKNSKSKWYTRTPTHVLASALRVRTRSHITWAVAAMDSCFGLVRPHQHGIAVGQKIGLKALSILPFTAKAGAKYLFKRQLHSTHTGRPWVGVRVCHVLLLFCFFNKNLLTHRSAIKTDPHS